MMAPGISGKVASITGGRLGIGAATAAELQTHGAHVAVLDVQPQPSPPGMIVIETDITDERSVDRAFVEVRQTLGGRSVCGQQRRRNSYAAADELTVAEWAQVMSTARRSLSTAASAPVRTLDGGKGHANF